MAKSGAASLLLAITLSACSSGETDAPAAVRSTGFVDPRETGAIGPVFGGDPTAAHAAPKDNVPATGDPVKGVFSPVFGWPIIGIHSALLPDGRVMTYGSDKNGLQTGKLFYDVWNPTQGTASASHLTLDNTTNTDIFCSAQLLLAGGGLQLFGGDIDQPGVPRNQPNSDANLFTASTNTLSRNGSMQRKRWYASATMLGNGEVYVQGGLGGADRPEVRGNDGNFRLLSGADTSALPEANYPRNFLAPNGKVFGLSNKQMYEVDPSGAGSISLRGSFPTANYGWTTATTMFAPGMLLQTGGGPGDATNLASIIDINGATPVVTTAPAMSFARHWGSATVLADGRVAISGGSRVYNALTDVARTVEIYNPRTNSWTLGATAQRARLYHSTAILLPDASVLTAGGGAPGPETNLNAELWFPPYLFNADGTRAARPVIDSAPSVVDPRSLIEIGTSSATAIARVTLVRANSTTHSFDMSQQFLELVFAKTITGLSAALPSNAALTPPGTYMLFVLNAAGVPSLAKLIRINAASAAPDPLEVPIWRYSAPEAAGGNRYLFSQDPLIGGEWTRETRAFTALKSQQPGSIPIYRLKAAQSDGKTRYSLSAVTGPGWTNDGVAFYAYASQPANTRAVNGFYRVLSNGWHFGYGIGTSFGAAWTSEGPQFYVPINAGDDASVPPQPPPPPPPPPPPVDADLVPVYRYSAPEANGVARYLFTQDAAVAGEWTREAQAFSAFKSARAGTVAVYRYKVTQADGRLRYMLSGLSSAAGWTSDGIAFYGFAGAATNSNPLQEFYRVQPNGWHFTYGLSTDFGAGWNPAGPIIFVPKGSGDTVTPPPPPPPPPSDPDLVTIYRHAAPEALGGSRYQFSSLVSLGGQWVNEARAFSAYKVSKPGTIAIYTVSALQSDGNKRYALSTNSASANGWTNEAIAFYAYAAAQSGTEPINEFHRVLANGWHLTYSSAASFGAGWTSDGAVFHAPKP